jgi:PKD domain
VSFLLPDGTMPSIPAEELEARASNLYTTEYLVRATPGEAGETFSRSGMPVQTALQKAGVQSYGYLTIPRPTGTTAYLPKSDFEEPSPFEEGKLAVFSVDGPSTRFLRPLLGPDDVNAEDNIATVSGEALIVGVHSGNVVEVQVSPPSASTTAASPVEFSAAATGGLEGETFTYDWSFGDGTTATTGGSEPVPHTFTGSGTYQVRVAATGSLESGGESGPVEVVVGNPPTTEAPGAATTPQPPTKKPAGAPGKGGEGRGGKGSKPAPSGGRKKKKGKNESSARRGGSPTGGSHPDDSAGPSPAPPESVAPEAPITLPTPAPLTLPEEPSATAPEGEAPAVSAPPTRHAPSPAPTTEGELVEGRLVGDELGPTTLEEAVGGSSEGQGSRSAPGAVGKGGVGVPVGALIVVALLAGGALFEWRRSRPIS